MSNAPTRIVAIEFVASLGLLVIQLILGLLSGSIAVLSDALDTAVDLVSAATAFFSVRLAAFPADEEHPYGHGKIESISASVSAGVLAVGVVFVAFVATRRLILGIPDINVALGLPPMLLAVSMYSVLAYYMRREGRRTGSMALAAEATHQRAMVVQAAAVIAGLVLVGVTDEKAFDPLVALGVAAYMGWTARCLVRTATSEIMDSALPPEDIAVIHDILVAHKGQVRGFHRLRTRRSGATRHVDMHLLLDAHLTVVDVHEISEAIEGEIAERLPGTEVVIHMEPDDGQGDRPPREQAGDLE